MEQYNGFLLQIGYRVENKAPVVHLSGRLTDGRSFLIRETRRIPHFYIRDKDVGHSALRKCEIVESDFDTLDGNPAAKVIVQLPADTLPIRDRFHAEGIPTYQADLRFPVSYLIEKNIRGGIGIKGEPDLQGQGADIVFTNPDIFPSEARLKPRVLSFDIETDPDARRLLAIAIYGLGADEVLVVDPGERPMPHSAIGFSTEQEAIEAFVHRVAELDPDVLTGWNVIDFDLTVLLRIARRCRIPLRLGRTDAAVQVREAQGFFASSQAIVHGRVVLDGIALIRGAFMPFKDYSLDAVSREVLGEGKAVEGDVKDRAEEILERYNNDLLGFVHYAGTDARLALQIVEKLQLIPLAIKRSTLTGMTMDRVSASVASFDFVYLSQLRHKKIVAPSVNAGNYHQREVHSGGLVLEPSPGMFQNVWTFDYKSLYPSVMRTFNIDPVSYLAGFDSDDPIETTNFARFSRDPGILPSVLDTLFEEREKAKRDNDPIASQAIKILMNSFYGVLATPVCRFHNSKLANAITSFGRYFLRYAKDWFESLDYRVLYGDTDSVFVESGMESESKAYEIGSARVEEFNLELAAHVQDKWSVDCKLTLEFEHLYSKFFLPAMRKSNKGARKRYAGMEYPSGEVEFTGMEVVRRDWTDLAKEVQRELFRKLFTNEPVDEYLREYVRELRSGTMDEKLVYRKGLRKPLSKYTKVVPPHVAAGRKMERPGKVIEYVITLDGPEPLEDIKNPPDREHYVQRQIRPVAEPVLAALGLDFDAIAERYYQPDLFANVEE